MKFHIKIICLSVILLSFFLGIYSADDDVVRECSTRSGLIGIFVLPIHCEDPSAKEAMQWKTQRGPYGAMSKPVMFGNKICCKNISSIFTANRVCKNYMSRRIVYNVQKQILQGTAVFEGEIPHMAAIGYKESDVLEEIIKFNCAGTLISDFYVLTAAHCISSVAWPPPHLVRLGVISLNVSSDDTDFLVKTSIIHPQYNRIKNHNDIGLLILEKEVVFSLTVFPACLGTATEDPVAVLTIAGWGILKKRTILTSNELLKANVEAVGAADCTPFYFMQRWAIHNPDGLPAHQMCARGAKNNTEADSCPGDSGGPLQEQIDNNSSVSRVVGVISYGKACGSNVPGIYTRVSVYLPWIISTVWPEGFTPPRA